MEIQEIEFSTCIESRKHFIIQVVKALWPLRGHISIAAGAKPAVLDAVTPAPGGRDWYTGVMFFLPIYYP